jgi:Fic family protein
LIVSTKPPYSITSGIMKEISSISEKLGEVKAKYLNRPSQNLRKQNRIKTIHSSLKIEGNTLTQEQITDIIENKRVIGPQNEIQEVTNVISVYDNLHTFNHLSQISFLVAHKLLMEELIEKPGNYRTENADILHSSRVAHLAPSPGLVPSLMKDLFTYLITGDELTLVKSCVFHYEMEFIHPFADGNGRMGRLWQTLILMKEFPVFEYLPYETMIQQTQDDYYRALSASDKSGNSTDFVHYMLHVINSSLGELLDFNSRTLRVTDRIENFITMDIREFSRKNYMNVFKDISTATASRDLKYGVESGFFKKTGTKNKTIYRVCQNQ